MVLPIYLADGVWFFNIIHFYVYAYKFWSAASPSSCRSHECKDCFKLKNVFLSVFAFHFIQSRKWDLLYFWNWFLFPLSQYALLKIYVYTLIVTKASLLFRNLIKCKSIFFPFFSLFKEVPITNNNIPSFSLLPLELTMLFFLCHDVQINLYLYIYVSL